MEHVRDVLVAAETGNTEALQAFIELGQVDCADEEGSTPLMYAAANGQEKAVRQLLESGVDVDHQNHYGWTALLQASCYGHHEVVYTLLKHQADINLCNSWGATPLVAAAQGGFTTVVNGLLDGGAEVRREEEVPSITPLMAAAQCGNEAIVTKLLAHGSNINAQLVATRWTALMLAALNNQGAVVKVLLRHGAVKEMRDVNGNRAADLAASLGHTGVASLLPDDNGIATLTAEVDIFEAVMLGNMDTLSDVLKGGAAIANMVSRDGATPLMYATRTGKKQAVQLLLDAGADIDVQDPVHGWTAFMHAVHHKHQDIARLLTDRGADVSLRAKNGSNAFDIAHLTRDPAMIQLVASAAIQQLKGKVSGKRRSSQQLTQLGTLSEEEGRMEDGTESMKLDEREGADVLVSHEDIVSRLSNAYQKTDELCIPSELPDKRGFLTPPRRTSPAPTFSPAKETTPSSTKPAPSSVHHEPQQLPSPPQPVSQTDAAPPKKSSSSSSSSSQAVSNNLSPNVRPRPPELKIPSRGNNLGVRSVTPTPFSRLSPVPKSPKSQSANPFSFHKASGSGRKDVGGLSRGRPLPSFPKSGVPQSAEPSSTPKFFTSRRSSVEFPKKPALSGLRPRSVTGPDKKFPKKPSFEKLKISSKGPGLSEVLAKSSLSQYLPLFENEEMDLQSFITLSEQDLEEIGVSNAEDRKALLSLIKSLKTTSTSKKSDATAGSKFTFQ